MPGFSPDTARMDGFERSDSTSPRLFGLPPVVDARSSILVLGSFPSVRSLEGQQYYGHPRNHFWTILALASGEVVPDAWPLRSEWLLSHGLALWDVIGSCARQGSLDQAIKDPAPNELAGLLARWPGIRRILTNGQTAGRLFTGQILPGLAPAWHAPGRVIGLPSTSPIPTRQFRSAADKLAVWRQAIGWPADPMPGDPEKPG